MLIHTPSGESHLLDFFVASPQQVAPAASHVEFMVDFEGAVQQFNGGPATCGVYGTAAGIWEALNRFGTADMRDLAAPAVKLSTRGRRHLRTARLPLPDPHADPHQLARRARRLRARRQHAADRRAALSCRSSARRSSGSRRTGPTRSTPAMSPRRSPTTSASTAARSRATTSRTTRVEDRVPGETEYRGRRVITNPPPSSGGLLIADSFVHLSASRTRSACRRWSRRWTSPIAAAIASSSRVFSGRASGTSS